MKFSGDLDDQTCREDLHEVFSGHGEIKWIHFVRGAKEVSNLTQGLKICVLKFENEWLNVCSFMLPSKLLSCEIAEYLDN